LFLKKAKRVRLGFEQKADTEGGLLTKALVLDTELIRYKWNSLNGTYPDYGKVIPTEFVAEARFDTREALKAGLSLSALSLDKETPIIIAIKGGMMRLSVNDDRGEAQIQAQAEGEAETAVNGRYLAQALKALGGIAELKVKDPQSPMLFEVDGYRIVVMPVAMVKKATAEAVAEAEKVVKAKAEVKAEAEESGLITCPYCQAQFGERDTALDTESGHILCPECGGDLTEAEEGQEARAEMEAHSEEALPPKEAEGEAQAKGKPKSKRKAKEPVAVA
jgi:Zn finger protein HypA/HybF involved in hydrogenase expression